MEIISQAPSRGSLTSTTTASAQGEIPKGDRSKRVTELGAKGGMGVGGGVRTGGNKKPPGQILQKLLKATGKGYRNWEYVTGKPQEEFSS